MSDIESLRGKSVKDTWENILRFNNQNQGISNTVQSVYDGAGNPLPLKVARGRIEVSSSSVINALITANVSIVAPTISSGTMYSSTSGSEAITASDSNIPLTNYNLTSYIRDMFLHHVTKISGTGASKLTINPNLGKFFIVDRTSEPTLNDIQISSMTTVFNSSFSSNGYAELFVYLHATGTTVSVPVNSSTTPIRWHSPTTNGTPQSLNMNVMSGSSSCLFTLQTFDRGTTWHGKIIAKNLDYLS